MIEKSHRWQKTAIAAAAIALSGLSASPVLALSLGRITVQSALGEPLRAEIDVPSISADEASSLKANVASPAAFTAAGLDYNPAMSGLQAQLARRSDGRSYIRLSSDRPINEPFVDMILEASWSSGRIVRDYTMLFDPPSLKAQAPAPTLPQTVAATPAPAAVSVPAKPVAEAAPVAAAKPAAAAPAPVAAKAARSDSSNAQQVTVQAGDSASKLATRYKPADVSLDQMLVAMLRANPDAFAKGNLNRLRAGSVLDLPSADQAKAMSAAEASQTVVAQSKDFNEFRRNLAGNAPVAAVEAPSRKATGSVDAKVDDKKAASNAPDKLTLSKGATVQSKADDAKIAKERADKDAAARAAEIAKNIADLNKLSAASAPKAAAGPAVAASQTAPAKVGLDVAAAKAPEVSAAVAAAAPPVAAASAAAKSMPPVPESSLVDDLMEDPTLPLAGVGLLALLGGFFFYKRRQNNKQAAHADSSFLESRLQPDSFFGASGGQRVDTQDAAGGSSSLSYTSSQLGAADDVDPVAEADVYMAYGRDAQAEEILKEAARHNPGRLAIHTKLMEVYAKRRDAANFQISANHAFQLVGVNSPEWVQICEMGLSIDPENPLYQPGVASASAFGTLEPTVDSSSGDSTIPISSLAELPAINSDLDLDLDFSAEEEAAASAAAPLTAAGDEEKTQKLPPQPEPLSNSLDFDISGPGELSATSTPAPSHQATSFELPHSLPDLSAAMDGISMKESGDTAPAPAIAVEEAPAKPNDGMLEFDLGSLSLDLEPAATAAVDSTSAELTHEAEEESSSFNNDSLETKLALAEEFVSIGDQDGARALIEEVVAEATGPLRDKAQRALAKLS